METRGREAERAPARLPATAYDGARGRRHRLAERFAARDRRPAGLAELDLDALPAGLRILLLHDGTLVTCLEALRLTQVVVEVGREHEVALDRGQAASLEADVGTLVLSRPAVLRDALTGEALVAAESLILRERLPAEFACRLATAEKGIGAALREAKVEHRRELLWCGVASGPVDGQRWTGRGRGTAVVRCYRMIHRGKPAVCIRETFPLGNGRWSGC